MDIWAWTYNVACLEPGCIATTPEIFEAGAYFEDDDEQSFHQFIQGNCFGSPGTSADATVASRALGYELGGVFPNIVFNLEQISLDVRTGGMPYFCPTTGGVPGGVE